MPLLHSGLPLSLSSLGVRVERSGGLGSPLHPVPTPPLRLAVESVDRETERGSYGGAEYVVAKAAAELPLDCAFAALHGWALDRATPGGLRCRPQEVLPLCAAASASLGLVVGAATSTGEAATALGVPLVVIHMLTGIINPAGEKARARRPVATDATAPAASPRERRAGATASAASARARGVGAAVPAAPPRTRPRAGTPAAPRTRRRSPRRSTGATRRCRRAFGRGRARRRRPSGRR